MQPLATNTIKRFASLYSSLFTNVLEEKFWEVNIQHPT
jgi:hypothetical protein